METQAARPGPLFHVRAVLFDLDSAVVDLRGMKRVASDAAARAMLAAGADFPFTPDEAGDILFGEYLADLESGTLFEAFLRRHHRRALGMGQHQVDRITAAAVNAYLRAKTLRTEPFAGVRPTLVALARAGLRLGVLTDAPRFKAYQRLDAAGLSDFFEFVLAPAEGARGGERPFRAALDLLGLPPHQVLVVGGRAGQETGPGALGVRSAWARYGSPASPVPLEADVVLERVEDLIRHLPLAGDRR
ncbi:MAG TPA: HAD family hydrolase [Candidatus Thermoplasmatota archaeon]|nr:HAD family hydrolase [Candidatus Thermoplasmatota archaeon]